MKGNLSRYNIDILVIKKKKKLVLIRDINIKP